MMTGRVDSPADTSREQRVGALKRIVENPNFSKPEDVEIYFEALTKYIWDHKMIGTIYDLYMDDTRIHGENGALMEDVAGIVKHTSDRLFTIPDIQTTFLEIHASRTGKDEFRFIQVTHLDATFTGPCMYGPPGGERLNQDNNMSMCECLVKKIDGQWRVTEEWCLGFDDFFKVRDRRDEQQQAMDNRKR